MFDEDRALAHHWSRTKIQTNLEGEMGTMQWLVHFQDSVARPRNFDFSRPLELEPYQRGPLLQALGFFHRAINTPGIDLRTKIRKNAPVEYVKSVDLYVREKGIHAELLAQLIWRLEGEPARRNVPDFMFRRLRRRLPWQQELAVLLTGELVMVPVLRVIANSVTDPLTKEVIQSILADQAFHIGFHLEHLKMEVRQLGSLGNVAMQTVWSSFFASMLGVLLTECHDMFDALGYSRLTCWTDAWHLFAQVQVGLNGSNHLNPILMHDGRLRFAL